MAARRKPDPRITKRRVTMTNVVVLPADESGRVRTEQHQAVDYVLPDHLDAYVEDAKLRWALVEVSDAPDAGPAGYEGATTYPEHLRRGVTLEQHLHDTGAAELPGVPGFGKLKKGGRR